MEYIVECIFKTEDESEIAAKINETAKEILKRQIEELQND